MYLPEAIAGPTAEPSFADVGSLYSFAKLSLAQEVKDKFTEKLRVHPGELFLVSEGVTRKSAVR